MRRVIQSVGVANSTRWPCWAAMTPRAVARWVFPVPGGPSSTMLRASVRNAPEASAPTCCGPRVGRRVEVLQVLRAGILADRIPSRRRRRRAP